MRLKVGDIEMDSMQGIAVLPQTSQPYVRPSGKDAEVGVDQRGLCSLFGLQVPTLHPGVYWALSGLGVLVGAGLSALLIVDTVTYELRFVLLSLIVSSLGLALGSAALAWRVRMPVKTPLTSPQVRTERAVRIATLLSKARLAMTVEEIATALSWTESAVVTGLRQLVDSGRVREDLDVESGHWNYQFCPAREQSARMALPIAERERSLFEASKKSH